MKIELAKNSGFCGGVSRAMDILLGELAKGAPLATLGPIVHNNRVVDDLQKQGVIVIDTPSQNPDNRKVIIRSHGVAQSVYDELNALGTEYVDATCPSVYRIHDIVKTHGKNALTIIVGKDTHPEVIGIAGHCSGDYVVVSSCEQITNIEFSGYSSVIMVAQTTLKLEEWKKCCDEAKKVCTTVKIFDTICNAMAILQTRAMELAKRSDLMLVIGGRHSSNTNKLVEVCGRYTRTVLLETAEELSDIDLSTARNVGITAGASTPQGIIKEVLSKMNELPNTTGEELSFEEMLNESFKSTYNGEKVTAVVTALAPNEIAVDIGTKHAGYVPLHELTDDPNLKPEDITKVGDSIELIVVRVNDVEGTVMLSKKRMDAIAGFEAVAEAEGTDTIFDATITETVNNGVLALVGGVKVFIPASHSTVPRGEDLAVLLRKKVKIKILEVNRSRRRAVGSIREAQRAARKIAEDAFWSNAEIGTVITGTVKSLTDYGVFVDIGGIDGMVHITELSWSRLRHPSQAVSVGDVLEVYIKDLDFEKRKISLGYKKQTDNPWEVLKNTYNVGDTLTSQILSVTTFGAFAQVIPGVDGLIHISQISHDRVGKVSDVLNVGDEVTVKITDIDYERGRVSLSIKALLEQVSEQNEDTEAAELLAKYGTDSEEPTEAE